VCASLNHGQAKQTLQVQYYFTHSADILNHSYNMLF